MHFSLTIFNLRYVYGEVTLLQAESDPLKVVVRSDEMLQVKPLALCLAQEEGGNDFLVSLDLPFNHPNHRAHQGLSVRGYLSPLSSEQTMNRRATLWLSLPTEGSERLVQSPLRQTWQSHREGWARQRGGEGERDVCLGRVLWPRLGGCSPSHPRFLFQSHQALWLDCYLLPCPSLAPQATL